MKNLTRIVLVVTWRILWSILKGWFKDNFSFAFETRFDTVFLTIQKCGQKCKHTDETKNETDAPLHTFSRWFLPSLYRSSNLVRTIWRACFFFMGSLRTSLFSLSLSVCRRCSEWASNGYSWRPFKGSILDLCLTFLLDIRFVTMRGHLSITAIRSWPKDLSENTNLTENIFGDKWRSVSLSLSQLKHALDDLITFSVPL